VYVKCLHTTSASHWIEKRPDLFMISRRLKLAPGSVRGTRSLCNYLVPMRQDKQAKEEGEKRATGRAK
jgi:hypothetical protein